MEVSTAYLKAGTENLKLFKDNSSGASFYEVPIGILDDKNQFVLWAEESLNIQKNKNYEKQYFQS